MFYSLLKKVLVLLAILLIARYCLTSFYLKKPYNEYVEKYSKEYNIDENFVYAVIFCESRFDPKALSHKGAKGLMQIADITGAWGADVLKLENFQTEDVFDEETNIKIGCWYLGLLSNQYGDEAVVLAAYNAGSGNVSKWLSDEEYSKDGKSFDSIDVIPFKETSQYVKKVKVVNFLYDLLY